MVSFYLVDNNTVSSIYIGYFIFIKIFLHKVSHAVLRHITMDISLYIRYIN
jgi:hypothetical protein